MGASTLFRVGAVVSVLVAMPPAAAAAGEPSAEPEDDILLVLDLPLAAQQARASGVPEAVVAAVLASARDAGLPAQEAVEILEVTAEAPAAGEGAARRPPQHLGAFVRVKLAEGLRGPALAEAIRAYVAKPSDTPPAVPADVSAKLEALAKKRRKEHADRLRALAKARKDGRKVAIAARRRHEARLAAARARLRARPKNPGHGPGPKRGPVVAPHLGAKPPPGPNPAPGKDATVPPNVAVPTRPTRPPGHGPKDLSAPPGPKPPVGRRPAPGRPGGLGRPVEKKPVSDRARPTHAAPGRPHETRGGGPQ